MDRKERGLLLHSIVPIFLGGVIYYIFSPSVLFVKTIDALIGMEFHITVLGKTSVLYEFVRNFFLDMLWAYALIFGLFYMIGSNAASLWKIFLIALSFSLVLEILQITPIAKGTFDFWDIVVEVLAEGFAVLIIKKYFYEEEKNENGKEEMGSSFPVL